MEAITREEKLLSGQQLEPITRKELFLAKAAGMDVQTPEPITREETFLSKISGGGGSAPAVIEPLSVTANGLYTPPEGVDGYSPVSVTVPVGDGGVRSLKKLLDTTKNAYYLFYGYKGASLDELIEYGDTSNVTNMSSMFSDCSWLTTIPLLDTSNVTNMSSMFSPCPALTTIPLLDTSNVTSMSAMFSSCSKLTTIPLLDTSNVTNMSTMFGLCSKLTTIPLLDTSNVTNMYGMFNKCSKLTTIPLLDTSNVTNMSTMFGSCAALTEIWIRNIQTNLTVGSGTSYGHLLTVESLVHLCNELRNVNAARTLTVGSANLTKLADVYVKLIDITDEMRAEDDLIDEKLPCVVCDSTDDGAMLISDYVKLKQWVLK